MKFFKSIWSGKTKEKSLLSDKFSFFVEQVIKEIDKRDSEINDDTFYQIICEQEINQFEANEIYIFLPIAFAQLWLQKVNWHEEYHEILPNKKEVSKRYDETLSFQIIIEIVKNYFENKPSKNTIIQIGGRSADFNAINNLLLEGGKIEDVKVMKTTIVR